MTRRIRSGVSRSPAPTQESEIFALADASIPWSASLVQPTQMIAGSRQACVIDVTAPVVLDAQNAAVVIANRRFPITWQGESSQKRQAATIIDLPPGRYTVHFTVSAGRERPYLRAGRLRVKEQR